MEPSGSWDSIHVFEIMERGRQAHYKLTSTIMLQLITRRGSADGSSNTKEPVAWKHDGEISLSGSMTRQVCITACVPRKP
jgi:capping protein beta